MKKSDAEEIKKQVIHDIEKKGIFGTRGEYLEYVIKRTFWRTHKIYEDQLRKAEKKVIKLEKEKDELETDLAMVVLEVGKRLGYGISVSGGKVRMWKDKHIPLWKVTKAKEVKK